MFCAEIQEDYEGDAVETIETLVVEARESGKRLDALLGGRMPEQSRSYFGGLCQLGMVLLDGKPVKKSAKVEAGQEIEVRFVVSPELSLEGEDIPLDVSTVPPSSATRRCVRKAKKHLPPE